MFSAQEKTKSRLMFSLFRFILSFASYRIYHYIIICNAVGNIVTAASKIIIHLIICLYIIGVYCKVNKKYLSDTSM